MKIQTEAGEIIELESEDMSRNRMALEDRIIRLLRMGESEGASRHFSTYRKMRGTLEWTVFVNAREQGRKPRANMKPQQCKKLDDCPKILMILDKDISNQQAAEAIMRVCAKCEEEK